MKNTDEYFSIKSNENQDVIQGSPNFISLKKLQELDEQLEVLKGNMYDLSLVHEVTAITAQMYMGKQEAVNDNQQLESNPEKNSKLLVKLN